MKKLLIFIFLIYLISLVVLSKTYLPTSSIEPNSLANGEEIKHINYYINLAVEKQMPPIQNIKNINVLTGVVFLPEEKIESKYITNKIIFIGYYDPNYQTGAINYENLLFEALKYPNPTLSIDPIDKENTIVKIDDKIREELKEWEEDPKKLAEIISKSLNNPKNKTILEKKLENLSIQTIFKYLDYQQDKIKLNSIDEIFDLYNHLYRIYSYAFKSEGYDEYTGAAIATLWLFSKTSEIPNYDASIHLIQTIQMLNIEQEYENLRNYYLQKGNLTEEDYSNFAKKITEMIYRKILSNLRVPQNVIDSLIDEAYQNSINKNYLDDTKMSQFVNQKELEIMKSFFINKILSFLIIDDISNYVDIPQLFESVKIENLSPNTEIFKILFLSDVSQKNLDLTANSKLQDFFEFSYNLNKIDILSSKGDITFTLVPKEVNIYKVMPNFLLFESFGNIQDNFIKIEITPNYNTSNEEKQLIKNYEDYINQNIKQLKQECPYIHKVSELVKILALANYIKKNEIKLSLDYTNPETIVIPEKIQTKVSALISKNVDSNYSFWFNIRGGVDFSNIYNNIKINEPKNINAKESLAYSFIFSEKALKEALNGNLENARYFAELSSQAMSGTLPSNINQITNPTEIEEIKNIKHNKLDELVAFNYFTISALQNYINQNDQDNNIQNLYNLMENYKKEYMFSNKKFDFDSFNLYPKTEKNKIESKIENSILDLETQLNFKDNTNKTKIEQIKNKINQTQEEIYKIKSNLSKINKEMLYNVKEYERWAQENEKYYKNIYDNSYWTLANLTFDKALKIAEDLLPQYKNQMDFIEKTKNYGEFSKWYYDWINNGMNVNLEEFLNGFEKAIELIGIPPKYNKFKDFLLFAKYSLETSYDAYNIYYTFQQYKAYEKILKYYSEAIEKQSKLLQKLEKDLKTQQEILKKLEK